MSTRPPSEPSGRRLELLQGTLDLIVLRMLETMGPQHAYAIASRLQVASNELVKLNQGTLYPALVRLEQRGEIAGAWGRTESGREAKYYALTRAGGKRLAAEKRRWRQWAGLMERLLQGDFQP
ncbi:MAG: PadR family transcriptional regulator [Terriglobales bacterium]